jgi:glucosamine--fructose-6-phosphate aminotransferase (isomerizing)
VASSKLGTRSEVVGHAHAGTRCARCLLPAALPGSNFNSAGECAWCQSGFPSYHPKGEEGLDRLFHRSRQAGGPADCLVGVSGGKDSSYVALQLRRKYDLRVEAFTYVHDAMSEFSIENARNLCRSLDLKHHFVSLPGRTHVDSFVAMFEAWLETEDFLVAAASCAACKHMNLLGTRLAQERGIPLVVWSDCPLEVPPFMRTPTLNGDSTKPRSFSYLSVRLLRQFVTDPAFRRAFLRHAPTCVYGYLSLRPDARYLRWRYPRVRQVHYFDYCRWDRNEILSALQTHTDWSLPESLPSDWHADCQLHILREYMSQRSLGASELDAHLSNQIRHGLMTREEGWRRLALAKAHHAAELPAVLAQLGLERLTPRVEPSCFRLDG